MKWMLLAGWLFTIWLAYLRGRSLSRRWFDTPEAHKVINDTLEKQYLLLVERRPNETDPMVVVKTDHRDLLDTIFPGNRLKKREH